MAIEEWPEGSEGPFTRQEVAELVARAYQLGQRTAADRILTVGDLLDRMGEAEPAPIDQERTEGAL